jgi:hypothetical protein
MWLLFAIFIGVSFILISIGIVFNIKKYNLSKKVMFVIFMISFITYVLDTLFSGIGGFEETGFSQISFILIFLIAVVTILTLVPNNINNAIKTKQLESEKIALNNKLQEIFNPKSDKKDEYIHNDTIFREGDKVLQTKNINDLEISNGDIGIIDSITKTKDGILTVVNFDGIVVEFSKKHFDDLKLGYAISIHKSQGSEFEIVIMPMDLSFKRMLYRKLLYTGVTRAKKSLTLVGEKNAFIYATSKLEGESRNTLLCDLLKTSINF